MSIMLILRLGIGLSVDVFAISVAIGALERSPSVASTARMAALFASASIVMLCGGWLTANWLFASVIPGCEWIVSMALVAIGTQILLKDRSGGDSGSEDWNHSSMIVLLSWLVSLDSGLAGAAAAVGELPAMPTIAAVGGSAFCLSIAGATIGARLQGIVGEVECISAVILIAIGASGLLL